MRILNLPRSFDTILDSGIKTLVVSGCSFTYNYKDDRKTSWPYVLADRLNIPTVMDCSLGAAGNYHISRSAQWCLETQRPDPNTTLVVIMWSGHGREDAIISARYLDDKYRFKFMFSPKVGTGLLSHITITNIKNEFAEKRRSLKDNFSFAIESYLNINSLYNYLGANGYKFLFLDFMDRRLTNRSNDFVLENYLPVELHPRINEMIPTDIENFYRWSLKRLLLEDDDFHPNAEAHEKWCSEVLTPYIINKFNLKHT